MHYPTFHFQPLYSFHNLYLIPQELWNVPEPPANLYIQGSDTALELFQKLPEHGIAVVGTRSPQARSIALTKSRIAQWAGTQLILISGLARGIDAAAHLAALEAGIPTIAILGAGLDLAYPRENEELRKRILQSNGLIVSEFPAGTPALGYQFLKRNRLIAGWSKTTWIVEASQRSGSLNTARWAREQNRVCLATPCYPGDPSLAGNQILIDRDHAIPFWGNHSLGAVWIELATYFEEKRRAMKSILPSASLPSDPKELEMTHYVKKLTHQQGGIPLQELLDWALSKNWTPEEFFTIFERAIVKKLIQNKGGVLLSL